MTNLQVYNKTLGFSFIRFLFSIFSFLVLAGICIAGYFIGKAINPDALARLIGVGVGLILGIVAISLLDFFIGNRIKAAQISMMTKGVTEGELPNHTIKAGFDELKGRFGRIATFFLINRAIKGIFNQLARIINQIGTAIGGQVGNSITSAVNSAVQTLVAYLCDCCLGWILFRKDINPFKAGCEGCVIFFKHGKTLVKNAGRIFGIGFLSFFLIGGAVFGLSYVAFSFIPNLTPSLIELFKQIAATEGGVPPEVFLDPTYVALIMSGIVMIILWGMLHSVLVKPFILVGVLRNYLEAGQADMPKETEFNDLANKSPKFRKLQSQIQSE